MLKKTVLGLACAAFALALCAPPAFAATVKKSYRRSEGATIYSTPPSTLPAEVYDPARERRNHDWLGGYFGGNGANDDDVNNNEEDDGVSTSPPPHRDGRRWRRRH
jgi:hypothetical protein